MPTRGLCTLKSNEEKSNYAGLAQENGFASAYVLSSLRLVKGTALLRTCFSYVVQKETAGKIINLVQFFWVLFFFHFKPFNNIKCAVACKQKSFATKPIAYSIFFRGLPFSKF
jgi:hypothetical protein